MTEEVCHEEWASSGTGARSCRGRSVPACRRRRLGDRGIDYIDRDNPRLREQVDRRLAAGAYVQEQRAPRQLEHGRSAWAARGDWGYGS